jgi:hypothetical protein
VDVGQARVAVATLIWAGFNVAAWGGRLEPLPDLRFRTWLLLATAATIGVGVLAGRWWILVGVLVPLLLGPASAAAAASDLGVVLPGLTAVASLVLLSVGVLSARIVTARAGAIVGSFLLAVPLLVAGWGVERTLWPYDASPSQPLPVDARAGAFQGVALGQPLGVARRTLRGGAAGIGHTTAPVGVTFIPGDAVSVHARGVSLLGEHGKVVTLFITNPRAEALAGVGVGDNLGLARARLRGLTCHQSGENQPTCAGRIGHTTMLLVGDPIRTITLSAIDTGWCLVRSATCRPAHPASPLGVR